MKKIIIIGAGVSGIAAGIYAQQSGLDAVIYEKQFACGGACTSWSRKGYTIEGAVHWLTDSSKKHPFYKIWNETGILNDDIETYCDDPYTSIEYNNDVIKIYRDIDALKAELMRVAKEDKKAIDTLCGDIRAFLGMTMPVTDIKGVKVKTKAKMGIKQIAGMMPAFPKMKKIMGQTVNEYLSMFTHEGIKAVLCDLMPKGYSAMALISTMATFYNSGYFPKGGAAALVDRMQKKFISLGGKICLSSPVEKIIVQDKKAKGVIVKGEEISADAVIVTRDLLSADSLFDNPPNDEWIQIIKATTLPQTCTFVSIGVKADLSFLPYQYHFYTDAPYYVAGKEQKRFGFVNYSNYKEYSPNGGTVLTTLFSENTCEWWKKAKQEGRYEEEKAKLAQTIKAILENKFAVLKDKIEMIDIATPLTYERYTGSSSGSWMSIMQPKQKMSMGGTEKGWSKDIKGVYFAGFRLLAPGGLPVALSSGRDAVQLICRDFDMVFQGRL